MIPKFERRRASRVPGYHLVNVSRRSGGGSLEELSTGRTLDLSPEGLCLELDHVLPQGSPVEVDIALGEDLVHLRGEVRWIADRGRTCALGLRFADPRGPEAETIRDHLLGQGRL